MFNSAVGLTSLVDGYFRYIEGEYHIEERATSPAKGEPEAIHHKVWDREPEPPTFSGLVFHLGFNSRQEFDAYEANGEFANCLKRAKLRVEYAWEKKLHQQSPTGAIYAFKSWGEKPEGPAGGTTTPSSLPVNMIESGPTPVSNEKDVVM